MQFCIFGVTTLIPLTMQFPKLKFSGYLFSIITLLVFTFLVLVSIKLTSPTKSKGINADRDVFSADRAFVHINKFASEPHMSGSMAKEQVCSYIVGELEQIGLEVDIQTTTVVRYDGLPVFGNVTNIVGRITGQNSSGALLVVGHYDTQPYAPGAADDGIAVGAMLEAAEILSQNYKLNNDIIFLFSDAEEVGLLGAEAFAKEHPWMKDVELVLNLEARGTKGPALAFEMSTQNGWIVKEFVKAMEKPFAGSMMYEVYQMIPNNTDFTVFKERGISGLNVAIVDGYVNYHGPTDKPENLSLASLQHTGSYLMGFALHFGNISLTQTKANDLVYFNIFGSKIIFYPMWVSWGLLVLSVILVVFFLMLAYARKYINFYRVLVSLIFTLAIAGISIGAVWGLNQLIVNFYNHYNAFYMSNFYNVHYYFVAYSLVATLAFILLFPFFIKRFNIYSVMASVFILLIVLSGGLIWFLPTASYITIIPLIFALIPINLILIVDISKDKRPWVYHGLMLAGLIPAIFMLSPYIKLIFVIFGLSMPYAAAALLVLLLLVSLPLLNYPLERTSQLVSVLIVLSVVVVLSIAHKKSAPTDTKPLHSNVMYAALTDSTKAYWFSENLATDKWNKQFFADEQRGDMSEFYPWSKALQLKAKAPFVNFEKPSFEVITDSVNSNLRMIEFVLKSAINPVMLDIIFPDKIKVRQFMVNGKEFPIADTLNKGNSPNPFFRLVAPSYGGDKIMVGYIGNDSLNLSTIEIALGIPQFEGVKPMPKNIVAGTGFQSYVTKVKTNHTLP